MQIPKRGPLSQRPETHQRRVPSTLLAIPDGIAGTNATLKVMRQIVRRHKKNADLRDLALSIVGHNRPKDWRGEVRDVWRFVKNNIRYVRDIRGVETVATPEKTLQLGQGDCDDQSVLLATLLETIGHPTRFMALGFTMFPRYEHVLTETKIGNRWIPLETTEDWPFGTIPQQVQARIVKQMPMYN